MFDGGVHTMRRCEEARVSWRKEVSYKEREEKRAGKITQPYPVGR